MVNKDRNPSLFGEGIGGGTREGKTRHRRLDWDVYAEEKEPNSIKYQMSYGAFNELVALLDIHMDVHQSMRSTTGNPSITPHM
jgi:hypothetical protein